MLLQFSGPQDMLQLSCLLCWSHWRCLSFHICLAIAPAISWCQKLLGRELKQSFSYSFGLGHFISENAVKLLWWFHICDLSNRTDHPPDGAEMETSGGRGQNPCSISVTRRSSKNMAGDFLMGTSTGKGIQIWNSCELVGYPAEVLRLGSGQNMETNKINVQSMLTLLLTHLCVSLSPLHIYCLLMVFSNNTVTFQCTAWWASHIREQWSLGFEYFQISGCILPLFILIST